MPIKHDPRTGKFMGGAGGSRTVGGSSAKVAAARASAEAVNRWLLAKL